MVASRWRHACRTFSRLYEHIYGFLPRRSSDIHPIRRSDQHELLRDRDWSGALYNHLEVELASPPRRGIYVVKLGAVYPDWICLRRHGESPPDCAATGETHPLPLVVLNRVSRSRLPTQRPLILRATSSIILSRAVYKKRARGRSKNIAVPRVSLLPESACLHIFPASLFALSCHFNPPIFKETIDSIRLLHHEAPDHRPAPRDGPAGFDRHRVPDHPTGQRRRSGSPLCCSFPFDPPSDWRSMLTLTPRAPY